MHLVYFLCSVSPTVRLGETGVAGEQLIKMEGEDLAVNCIATGNPAPTVVWQFTSNAENATKDTTLPPNFFTNDRSGNNEGSARFYCSGYCYPFCGLIEDIIFYCNRFKNGKRRLPSASMNEKHTISDKLIIRYHWISWVISHIEWNSLYLKMVFLIKFPPLNFSFCTLYFFYTDGYVKTVATNSLKYDSGSMSNNGTYTCIADNGIGNISQISFNVGVYGKSES